MNEQIWQLKSKIAGNFVLVNEERISSSHPPLPSIRKLVIDPEFDEKNNQTGIFKLDIWFAIDTLGEESATEIIADTGRDVFNYFLDLLTFLSGHTVTVLEPLSLTHEYPNKSEYRTILFPTKYANISSPVSLTNTLLLNIEIDSKIRRILSWIRKGIQEKDVVDSYISLCTALELLANQFEFEGESITICSKCGYKTLKDPSMRQQVEHFLVNEIGYPDKTFKSIWKTRNDITHGHFSRTTREIRELHQNRDNLFIAIIKGTKRLLCINISELPLESLPHMPLADPMLDIKYLKETT